MFGRGILQNMQQNWPKSPVWVTKLSSPHVGTSTSSATALTGRNTTPAILRLSMVRKQSTNYCMCGGGSDLPALPFPSLDPDHSHPKRSHLTGLVLVGVVWCGIVKVMSLDNDCSSSCSGISLGADQDLLGFFRHSLANVSRISSICASPLAEIKF